jgi:iron-sulfur cluster assembly protein
MSGHSSEEIEAGGGSALAATMFLLGSEMDYVEDTFHTGFVFNNPNEKGRCGCGESFHV